LKAVSSQFQNEAEGRQKKKRGKTMPREPGKLVKYLEGFGVTGVSASNERTELTGEPTTKSTKQP